PVEEGTTAHTKERCLEHQLAAARAEAERWRKKYEALRAGVERVADDLHMAADEAHDNWRITADFNEQGRSIGLEEAEQMVRRLLAEAGRGRMTTTLCPGDRVNWWHRQRGGYGYLVPVAGVVERVGPRRVQIRVAQQVRPGWWRQVV